MKRNIIAKTEVMFVDNLINPNDFVSVKVFVMVEHMESWWDLFLDRHIIKFSAHI